MEAAQGFVGVGAFSKERDARYDIGVVDELSVLAADGAGELAEADLGTLGDDGDVAHVEWSAVFREDHGVFDVVGVTNEADFADVDLLHAGLDKAAAGVGVVIGELLLDLGEAEAIVDQLVWIDADLILAGRAAEAGDVDDIGNLL